MTDPIPELLEEIKARGFTYTLESTLWHFPGSAHNHRAIVKDGGGFEYTAEDPDPAVALDRALTECYPRREENDA